MLTDLVCNLHLNGVRHHSQILVQMAVGRDRLLAGAALGAMSVLATKRAKGTRRFERILRQFLLHPDLDLSDSAAAALLWMGHMEAAIPLLARVHARDNLTRISARNLLVRNVAPEIGPLLRLQHDADLYSESPRINFRLADKLRTVIRRTSNSAKMDLAHLAAYCAWLVEQNKIPSSGSAGTAPHLPRSVRSALVGWGVLQQ